MQIRINVCQNKRWTLETVSSINKRHCSVLYSRLRLDDEFNVDSVAFEVMHTHVQCLLRLS